jgi:uncharacterized SAM-binding protein YcdF (DUF218 family)
MAAMARELRFPPDRIVTESQGRDTEEQARLIAEIVGKDRFLLVTSLLHMTRSVALFKDYGMAPVPAPTSFPASSRETLSGLLLPTASAAAATASVAHELLGMSWNSMKSVLQPK